MWTDYLSALPTVAAILNGAIALLVAQFFKDHPVAKVLLVIAGFILGAAAIGATLYSQHLTLVAKTQDQTKAKDIRNKLADFIAEGDVLLQATQNSAPLPPSFGEDWLARMINFLNADLGKSYVTRLNNGAGMPIDYPSNADDIHRGYYLGIRQRLIRLEQFSQEVRP